MATILVGIAGAAVWTDKEDYSPGSTVTISGDNSNDAGYLDGETVHVDVTGPNDWAAACEGTADEDGAWSCQVTLADGPEAVGSYEYTATGLESGVTESGTFTDGAFWVRAMAGATPIAVTFPALTSFFLHAGTNNCDSATPGNTAFQPTTLTTGGFVNVTGGITTVVGRSIKAIAPAVPGYTFVNWTVALGTGTFLNGSVAQLPPNAACFSAWTNTGLPTFVQANYVLAQGTLKVDKVLANAAGKTGNKPLSAFTFNVAGTTASSGNAFDAVGTPPPNGTKSLTVGPASDYNVTEVAVNGYTPSYSNCGPSLAVTSGNTTTCTITNTFNGYASSTSSTLSSASFTIGGSVTDTAEVIGDADGGDPGGEVKFYLCGPTAPAGAYPDCSSGGTLVATDATASDDGTDRSEFSSGAITPTAAGKYCFRAEYQGSTLYNGSSDYDVSECFTVNPATATVVYTGLFSGVGGTPTTLSATVTSGYQSCAASRAVLFQLDGSLSDTTANATTGSASGSGPYTGTASTTKTLAADQYEVTASVMDKDLGSDGIPECSEAESSGTDILSIAAPGSDAHGGGWYKVTGASPPRVNFGFAVKKQQDGSFKGQLLWMNTNRYKLKGSITGYGRFTCPTGDGQVCGVATGTGTLYEWDSGTGTWVNAQAVGFSAKFWDGGQTSCAKKNCAKQERPDWFGMEIAAIAIDPESAPQQLMGGSIKAGT